MLNISLKRVNDKIKLDQYESFKILEKKSSSSYLIRIMMLVFVMLVVSMFLPWTQNIRSIGYVTTISPEDRPVGVQSVIEGRIETWYVKEGVHVFKGDTIVRLSEAKQEYFDPKILENTAGQIKSKEGASDAYSAKAMRLDQQIEALEEGLRNKLEQNEIKRQQTLLKIESDSLDLVAAITKVGIAENQLSRMQSMYGQGLKSLTALEAKRLSKREADANELSIRNTLNAGRNEMQNLLINRGTIRNEYADKIAKANAEKMTALSQKYDTDAQVNKLESTYNAYSKRQDNYFLLAPIDGLITKAVRSGIGEVIKSGENIVTIVPDEYNLAVELYIDPVDMPLLDVGQKLRVQFDGWPAIVFSGWPDQSYGTFAAEIFSIDNDISDNGKYRILVSPVKGEDDWPAEVRVGGGANAIILLKNVNLGYEIWRQLNGFPPDYYKKKKSEGIDSKAPIRKIK